MEFLLDDLAPFVEFEILEKSLDLGPSNLGSFETIGLPVERMTLKIFDELCGRLLIGEVNKGVSLTPPIAAGRRHVQEIEIRSETRDLFHQISLLVLARYVPDHDCRQLARCFDFPEIGG